MTVTRRPRRLVALLAGLVLVALVAATAIAGGGHGVPSVGRATILVKFQAGTSSADQAAIHGRHGGAVVGAIAAIGVRIVAVPAGGAAEAARAYAGEGAVAYAEPDATASAVETPNDPSFALQWGMSKIGAPAAWDVSTGSAGIEVAVLDTGIAAAHPDLAGKVVKQVNFSASATLDDVYGHGTHVAGIAAALTNNGLGGAGLGWNASLDNVKVLGDSGSGAYSGIAQGITWAADNGADVINLSLGGTSASATLQAAVDYAWARGVVIVAAAGNNTSAAPFYPAYYANVIAVAATDNLDHLASYSDYGDWVDVAAPGSSIYSTMLGGGYGYKSGTSMASPFVAGLAALLATTLSDTNGDGQLNDEVRSRIQGSADDLGLAIGGGRINAARALSGATPPPPTSGTITGSVRDAATGLPLAGATVSDGPASTTSDASGAYALANVPPGSYTVTASASGYTGAAQSVTVTAGLTASASFALAALVTNGAIAGSVRDAATGLPLAGATVSDGTRSATSDASGAYAITNVPPGGYTVSASAAGYTGGSQSVSVTAGLTASASFGLTRQYMYVKSITFRVTGANLRTDVLVVDGSGNPVAGAKVTLTERWSGGTSKTFTAKTSTTGVASLTWQKAKKGTYTATVTGLSSVNVWATSQGVLSASCTLV